MLFAGIFFVMVMLAMAVGMPNTLNYYQENAKEMMISDYQLMLTSDHDEDGNKVATSNADAETFSSEELVFDVGGREESVTAYGIIPDSRYVKVPTDMKQGRVYASSALAGKFHLEVGDIIKLKDKYGYDSYEWTLDGIVDYDGGIAVFTDNKSFAGLQAYQTHTYGRSA